MKWITTHIEVEKHHHKQVCDGLSGVAGIASTPKEQQEFLLMLTDYTLSWKDALDDLDHFILPAHIS